MRFDRTNLLVLVLLLACACSQPPSLDGEWSGGDWGRVIFVGLEGNYSSTYGPGPGEIHLTKGDDGTYKGRWGEGEKRHGSIELRFESPDVLVGRWAADPDSTIQGQSHGLIRWTRSD